MEVTPLSKILWWERSRAERLHRMLRNVAIESGCRCRYDDHAGQAEVRHSTTIPIASGEREFTRFDFQDLFERRALDIAQPDVAQETGTELRKVSPVCTRSWTFVLGEEEYFLRAIAA
jgi:L-alanine-DL-glutamate epimerase-like enolase superfamily enzyme